MVAILPFLEDTAASLRWRAAYTLGRLQAPAAANRLTVALRDAEPVVRAMAARALTRSYVDTGGLAPGRSGQLLTRAAADANPQVKINALRSLAGFEDSTLATDIVPLLDDPLPNVQLQAATTAGALGGAEAARALARVAAANRPFGVRREALVGLARTDTAAFTAAAGRWRSSGDWRERAAAAEGTAIAGPVRAPVVPLRPGSTRDRRRAPGLVGRGRRPRSRPDRRRLGRWPSIGTPRFGAWPRMCWAERPSRRT